VYDAEYEQKGKGNGRESKEGLYRVNCSYLHTSVTMPAIMTCFFPVAFTAARKSALSHALTSPLR
jgi:hypothetical protein